MKTFNSLFKSPGLRKSFFNTIGNGLATSLSALSLIIISRILGPNLFGEFSVGFSLLMIFSRLTDVGLSTSIIKLVGQTHEHKKINTYFSLTSKYRLISTLIFTCLGLIVSSFLNKFLKLTNPSIILITFTLGLSIVLYEQIVTMILALHRIKQAIMVNAIQASTKLIAAIVFFLSQTTSVNIIFALYAFAPSIPVIFTKKIFPSWVKINLRIKSQQAKKQIIRIISHSYINALSLSLTENISIIFVQGFLSSYEAGLLGGASKIAMLFGLISVSIAQVLFARVAKYKSSYHLSKYLKKAIVLSIVSLFAFIAFIPFAKLSIILTIGKEYLSGTPILLILVAAAFILIATVPFTALFFSYEANWYFSSMGILRLVITLVGNIVFVPIHGLKAAALTQVVSRSAVLIMSIILGLMLYQKKIRNLNSIVLNSK